MAGRLAPDVPRRPGLRLKWNMGWMNDTLRYFAPIPSIASSTTTT